MQSTDTTEITLAGRKFQIPFLPFAANRIAVHSASHALKAINRLHGPEKEPLSITAIDYMYACVWAAISHVQPKMKREEFDSWGVWMPDLILAVQGVALQTGVLVKADKAAAAKGDGKPGEG